MPVGNNKLGTQSFNKRVCLSNICTGTFYNNDSDRHTMRIHGQMYLVLSPLLCVPALIDSFCPDSMGISPAICGICQKPLEVRHIHQMRQDFFLYSFVTPTTKTAMSIFPVAVLRREISPGSFCTKNPEHRIDKQSVIPGFSSELSNS